MPEALSIHPQTYRHDFPKRSVFTGLTYPPRDYAQGGKNSFTSHEAPAASGTGDAKVKSWRGRCGRAGHRLLGRKRRFFKLTILRRGGGGGGGGGGEF